MSRVSGSSAPGGGAVRAGPAAPGVHLHAGGLRYAGRAIFEALDLSLPGARTTCLLGPSGVGKTSLLRLI
ncbi:MAG TPA: hypothetical protein VLL72_07045, partial [Kiloniellales bacterium]|nr:hypothetical protein [Kiloniellales bacterium]